MGDTLRWPQLVRNVASNLSLIGVAARQLQRDGVQIPPPRARAKCRRASRIKATARGQKRQLGGWKTAPAAPPARAKTVASEIRPPHRRRTCRARPADVRVVVIAKNTVDLIRGSAAAGSGASSTMAPLLVG